jgi:methyl-accepting chemotaxis protein
MAFENLKIKSKLIYFNCFIYLLIIASIAFISSYKFKNAVIKSAYDDSKIRVNNILNSVNRIGKKALMTASVVASVPITINSYKEYYYTKDFDYASRILEKEFKNTKIKMDKILGTTTKIHFHLPPAKSFYRNWTDKRGDDLSSFRFSILNISKYHKPLKGIETGRSGIVIRGIAPIFDKKDYLGSVEVIIPMKSLIKNEKLKDKESFMIFITPEQLEIAKKFKEKMKANISSDNFNIGRFAFATGVTNKMKKREIKESNLEKAYNSQFIYDINGNDYFIYFPIKNFAGKIIGAGLYRKDLGDAFAQVRNMIIMIVIVSIILFVFGIVLLYLISNSIIIRVYKLGDILKSFSNGNLNIKANLKGKDEIAELGKSMDASSDNLSNIIKNISSTSNVLAKESDLLSASMEQLTTVAEEQASEVSGIASALEELSVTSKDSLLSVEDMTKLSNENALLSNDGKDNLTDAVSVIEGIKEKTSALSESIHNLENSSVKINDILSVINDIADQTNLLALNAAIEAARAGEAGRGFAVVADEIRKLAERTQNSTKEIIGIIDALNQETKTTSKGMKDAEEQVSIGVSSMKDIEEKFKIISENASAISEVSKNVETIIMEQSTTIQSTSDNASSIATTVEESNNAINSVRDSIINLKESANKLDEIVKKFSLS